MTLDFSFYNWDVISNYIIKGLYFSLILTLVATVGGVIFGTVLALMRLCLLYTSPNPRDRG